MGLSVNALSFDDVAGQAKAKSAVAVARRRRRRLMVDVRVVVDVRADLDRLRKSAAVGITTIRRSDVLKMMLQDFFQLAGNLGVDQVDGRQRIVETVYEQAAFYLVAEIEDDDRRYPATGQKENHLTRIQRLDVAVGQLHFDGAFEIEHFESAVGGCTHDNRGAEN